MPVLAVALVIQRSGPDAASQNAVRTVRQATETDQEVLPATINAAILILRIACAMAFLYHGSAILFGAFAGPGPQQFYGVQGDGKVSHIDIRDIAAMAVKALTENGHEGKAYTLTGPEALSNARVAEILSEDTGREIRYVDLPPEQFKQALLAAGVPEWSANALIDLQLLYRRGGANAVTRDVEELLGRKPITFEQFSRDYADAFRPKERAAS
jgi:nucleoside-diphosphate-sugar epimerase